MAQIDFLSAIKQNVDVDEDLGLQFIKIQQNVAGGFFLTHFKSRVLPAEVYLQIEKFVKKTVGQNTKVCIEYTDKGETDEKTIEGHLKELCRIKRPSLTPFLTQVTIKRENSHINIDFANDCGRDVFLTSGMDAYIEDYFLRCFGEDIKVKAGRRLDVVEDSADCRLEQRRIKQLRELPEKKALPEEKKQDPEKHEKKEKQKGSLLLGKKIEIDPISVNEIEELTGMCAVHGDLLDVRSIDIKKDTKQKKAILIFNVTDFTSTITCKAFLTAKKCESVKKELEKAQAVKVAGRTRFDTYTREVCINVTGLEKAEQVKRQDDAEVKRVELHMHTKLSALDGVADETEAVKRAAEFGHEAVAITDHGVVQGFPGAFDMAKKCGIKVIYGMEAYMMSDEGSGPAAKFEDEYVVFDLETTGFYPDSDGITEIGAVRLRNGKIIDEFSTLVNPERNISEKITQTTGITNEMVADKPKMPQALKAFKEYIGDAHLAAHNAPFDMGFIKKHGGDNGIEFDNICLDTVTLFRKGLPGHRSYSLGKIAADLGIEFKHHRALDDAKCTAQIMVMAMDAIKRGVLSKKSEQNHHIILLCKNKQGLFNLYKLVSESHLNYFYYKPRIPKFLLEQHREGLIVGSACESGEIIQAMLSGASDEELCDISQFYDYLEVQPDTNNEFMVREGKLRNMEEVRDITRKIVKLGEMTGKPVCATCDAHFIEPTDEYFRRILLYGQGFKDADYQAPLYFRTTDEMLGEFSYLGQEKAFEIVVTNTRAVAQQVESIKLLPDEPAMPHIEGAADKLEKMAYENARAKYGEKLPDIVEERLSFELDSIIKHGYGVLYYIAYELVKHSLEDGYLVGSRGSVGSSFAATMAGITEVNPLPPHYVCPSCKHSDFDVDKEKHTCGPDLPAKSCPECGTEYKKEGFDIPFATFLGINADKVPDIDLNFSGEYQPQAHKFTVDFFGEDYVFRGGHHKQYSGQNGLRLC